MGLYCGVDPGNKGAICVLDTDVCPVRISFLDLNKHTIYEAVAWLYSQKVEHLWTENVHAFPGMSAKSNFGFGKSIGIVNAIMEIATKGSIPINKVTPQVWQKYIGVTSKGKAIKTDVAERAVALYPTAIVHGTRGGLLDGRSDALMIAHYGANYKE